MKLNPEKELAKLLANLNIGSLMRVVKQLDAQGREIILKGLSQTLDNNTKQLLVAQLKSSVAVADTQIKEWLVKSISTSYVHGMNEGVKAMALQGIKVAGVGKITVDLLKNSAEFSPHLSAVNAMLSDTYLDFGSAMTNFTRSGERILNDALKKQIRSSLITGRLEGQSVQEIKKTIKQTLADKGFIALTDKGGKSWSLDTYSEMLARTHLIKANNEGAINRAKDFDVDIIEISTHNTDCPICSPEEGKLYSLSGKSENHPAMTDEPPFHPNCKHSVMYRPDLN